MRISTAGKDIFPTLLWQYKLTVFLESDLQYEQKAFEFLIPFDVIIALLKY